MAPWNPPRKGKAGKTGSFEIVFKSGATVTLEKVSLEWLHRPNTSKKAPIFKAHFAQATETICWNSSGDGFLDPDSVEAIFRLDEDMNS